MLTVYTFHLVVPPAFAKIQSFKIHAANLVVKEKYVKYSRAWV